MCFGAPAPVAPPPPPPPPQYPQAPTAAVVRNNVAAANPAPQNGTLLTGGQGDNRLPASELGKKTLLGQ